MVLAVWMLFDREGGVKVVSGMLPREPLRLVTEATCVLIRGRVGGEVTLGREAVLTSEDWDRAG